MKKLVLTLLVVLLSSPVFAGCWTKAGAPMWSDASRLREMLNTGDPGESKRMRESAKRDGVLDYAIADQYVRIIESKSIFLIVEYKGKKCITYKEVIECR